MPKPTIDLHHGDCRDVLRTLPSDSLDSCCTDPPYALVSVVKRFGDANAAPATGNDAYMRASAGFMGKTWDTGETAFSTEFWAEVYRVLKPGAFVAAFGASRGYHRMACAIEDAGFEIRDSLMWVYGTGFPKSQDVSKFIDKRGGNSHLTREIGEAIKAARESRGMSAKECDKLFCGGTTNWSWFEGRPVGQRAPTADTFAAICAAWPELLPLADAVAEVEREVTGQKTSGIANKAEGARHTIGAGSSVVVDITAPATDAAREWEGWGTALKPAFEPIVLARKPLSEGTVAANVLRWRTGALNIDASRIHTEGSEARTYTAKRTAPGATQNATGERHLDDVMYEGTTKAGRWPANVVHSGEAEVTGAFPNEAHRFFFNTAESDTQWLARNLPSERANAAIECFNLQSELAASVLTRAVGQSMQLSAPISTGSPAPSTNFTPSELRRISVSLIETIPSFERKCSPESLPARLTLSDNLASIAVACEQIDTITITISLSKSNGSVAPVTFNITRQNSDRGAKDCGPSTARFHYSAKASKADRAGSKHPTVKPINLMEWLATLITPPGGTVLDPFAGSGTTGAACRNKGFNCILVEREDEYAADIRRRLALDGDDALDTMLARYRAQRKALACL